MMLLHAVFFAPMWMVFGSISMQVLATLEDLQKLRREALEENKEKKRIAHVQFDPKKRQNTRPSLLKHMSHKCQAPFLPPPPPPPTKAASSSKLVS